MDFGKQYLTYSDYRSLGGTLDMMPFNLLEFQAQKILDARTQNRLCEIIVVPAEVKLCINEMIKVLQSYETYKNQNKAISSENTDGYSITYGGANSNITVAQDMELEDVMENYLMTTVVDGQSILYLGVC